MAKIQNSSTWDGDQENYKDEKMFYMKMSSMLIGLSINSDFIFKSLQFICRIDMNVNSSNKI